ncbi:hypothetical protein Fcan01_00239 [Folsomia candida]|uniref:Uncharacterized protein n=1 Tax=Folsomia candida TaxID=158441 RepID=A0A226EYT4_FOLCA|nr:hypothetical protein Fcan01_00239 [Folsomia candida]
MESTSFYSSLFSTTSLEYYPENTGSDFRNYLASPISAGYPLEVGLVSLTFFDENNPQAPQVRPPSPPPTLKIRTFLGGIPANGIVSATKKEEIMQIKYSRQPNQLINSFVSKLNEELQAFRSEQFEATLNQIVKGGIITIELRVLKLGDGAIIEISEDLRAILGFEESIFRQGNYMSDKSLDSEDVKSAYSLLNVGATVFMYLWRNQTFDIQLTEPEEYDIEALGQDLVLKLAAEGVSIGFLLGDENQASVRIRTPGAKFKLTTYLNRQLNLEDNFEFERENVEWAVPVETIPEDNPPVSPEIILPDSPAAGQLYILLDIIESQRFGQNVSQVSRIIFRPATINLQH